MAKDAYYFPHDSNARHDPKISALINDYGAEGYGVFWMIIEILSEQEEYKLRKFNKIYEGLARQLSIETNKLRSIIEAMLHDYELLLQDDFFIWSNSLLKRMQVKEAKRNKKIEAGRKGGLRSGVSRSNKNKNEANTKQNEALLEANEPKESKVKESKINNKNIYIIFDYWNSKNITNHRELNKKTESVINARLKTYSLDEIKEAIDNYKTIYESDKHYFSHKYTLERFMDPNKIVPFISENDPLKAMLKTEFKKDNEQQTYKRPDSRNITQMRLEEERKRTQNLL